MKPLPSYWTFDRFIRKLDNELLKEIMRSQVIELTKLGIIDTAFIGLDSTPVAANTSNNNPKSFRKGKFSKANPPRSDRDCGLGVHSASNQHNEKNREFYWGYKNHVLSDCITGLPVYEPTTPANAADSTLALSILKKSIYSLRTECERYNSRFKSTGQERLWVKNGNNAANLNSVAHIAFLAFAVAAVIAQSQKSYRALKSAKRTV